MDSGKIVVALLGIVVLFLVGAVFRAAQIVLVPLVVAGLLFFVLAPVVDFLERTRLPRVVAIVVSVAVVLGFFFMLGFVVHAGIASFIKVYPRYQHRLILLFDDAKQLLSNTLGIVNVVPDINWARTLRPVLLSVSGWSLKFIGELGVIMVFVVFILLERPYFQPKLLSAFDEATRAKVTEIFDHISLQVGRYLAVKLFISIITGIEVYLALLLLHVDFPVLWGIVAMVVNFIPNIGALFIIAITTLMAFVEFYPAYERPLVTFVVIAAIQIIMGNFVDPRLLGNRLNLSPIVILISLIFWGWLWGIVGAFLSVPIAVVVKIICDNVPALRPFGIFMGSGKIRDARAAGTR